MASASKRIEKICEILVLSRPDDPQVLGEMRGRFQELAGLGPESLPARLAEAAGAVVRLIDSPPLDVRGTLALIGDAVTVFQSVADGARRPEDAVFPEALGLAGAGPRGEAARPEIAPLPAEIDLELTGSFVVEAKEHLDASDVHLLTLEAAPLDSEALNAVFRAFHTIKGAAGYLELGEIKTLAHETETLLDLARKGELRLEGDSMDVTFDALDLMKRFVEGIERFLKSGERPLPDAGLPALVDRLRAIAKTGGRGAPKAPAPAVPSRPAGPVALASPEPPRPVQSASPLPPSEPAPETPATVPAANPAARSAKAAEAPADAAVREVVKVDAERLDRLVDLIGELVIAESMVSQSGEVRSGGGGPLAKHVGQLDKITRELQEMGMSLRMVPLRPVFQKMARVARDLSKKMGKPIDFVASGEEIEVDKSVADRIADPLVHIIRNALDHGIEGSPEDRTRAGKPETARIELRAFHREGNIYIEVEDDGRGLDREAILAKGIERGLVRPGESPPVRDIFNLIFLPGFSTARVVTEVSGRGVGMDVVRRNVEALRGHIELQSEKGRGTVVSLRLPLTLAIIEGMVVRVARERYIVPTLSVTRLVRPETMQHSTVLGQGEMLAIQGSLIPMFRLSRLLQVSAPDTELTRGVVVVVEDEGKQAALLADELLGQQQIVIKSLGDALERVPGVSGGAILPDGQVGLILDVRGLLRVAHAEGSLTMGGPVPEPEGAGALSSA